MFFSKTDPLLGEAVKRELADVAHGQTGANKHKHAHKPHEVWQALSLVHVSLAALSGVQRFNDACSFALILQPMLVYYLTKN